MSSLTNASVQTALEALPWPECNNTYDGLCVDNWPSGKGAVVYYDWSACSSSFINLPGINLLPDWLLGCMWALFLIWLFFGIAIISDAFVASIEVITAQTHIVVRVDRAGNRVEREEEVWNWAVANITVMAVGTSSPEILLSLIDTLLTLNKPAGQLGASAIVGSAAYNLFGISAVCTLCLPAGTFRKIAHLKVFIWTTSWSLWAYFWLWVVYKKVSPNVIEVWEAWLTLAFMPLFVWSTYMVDTRGWNWLAPHKNSVMVPKGLSDEESNAGTEGKGTTMVGQGGNFCKHSILYYRAMAMQHMGGNIHAIRSDAYPGQHAHAQENGSAPLIGRSGDRAGPTRGGIRQADLDALDRNVPAVFMKSPEVAVLECKGEAKLTVVRMHGDLKATVTVRYATRDDTAMAGLDYEPAEGELVFGPGEQAKDIVVRIIDDDMSEPDVVFLVELLGAVAVGGGGNGAVNLLQATTAVTIVDDDDSGVVMFELPTFEARMQGSTASVVVVRRHGADGAVSIDYVTKDGSAEAGKHFAAARGRLEFGPGEVRKVVSVPLLPMPAHDPSSNGIVTPAFRLVLSNPLGGVALGARKECRVALVPTAMLSKGEAGDKTGSHGSDGKFYLWSRWAEQFKTAMTLEFEEDDDNLFAAVSLHYVSITYKLMAACCPPAEWGQGYPLFSASLLLLAGLMAIVKEVGEMFGCACGLSDVMTGLSIVALGTSLPDAFVSRMAALSSDNADAAIGNIMGSNTCNVFLGLGLPWVIASSYYEAQGEAFFSQSGSLGFSLMIYFILAVVAIAILMWRRYAAGGELGASNLLEQWGLGALLGGLWLLFLLLSGLNDYGHIPDVGM
uniref:Calx-beta domain-containing protein n=1 Tax=Chlamydomonas euryale TaxID=1486919 RepID=A0A6U2FWI8_9CHLO|mmetsp:Transcript_31153/g.92877  ORF Transcript_31153/g.92877 Transcript_31153/m.92877 type:complete len:842 (+) Transcript_31153:1131-3656(+)